MPSFFLLSLWGCPSTTPPAPPPTTDVPVPTETADTAAPVDTDVEPPPIPEIDCRALPTTLTSDVLDTVRAYHGIAFDHEGHLASSDNTSLLRSTGSSDTALFVPNLGTLQQMAYLPNGDLVVAQDNGGKILLVHPDAVVETLATGIGAYGVAIGPDGLVYTANQTQIHQIDPTGTAAPRVWLPNSVIGQPKVITFEPDGSAAYVGTNQRNGNVFRVDLDSAGEPILPVVSLGQTGGDWHDAITLDACGNLYVNEYWTKTLYRRAYGADTWTPFVRFDQLGGLFNDLYGHGMVFGSGVGAWPATSAYFPLPYYGNRVGVFDLGVPSRDFNGGNYTVIR